MITIHQAEEKDREVMIDLYLCLLAFIEPLGFEVEANRENATFFVDRIFLPAIPQNEPVLLAWDEQDHKAEAVGLCVATSYQTPYPIRWKSAVEHAIFVKEAYRKQKIASRLRHEAIKWLKAKGVERLYTNPLFSNTAALNASLAFGFLPYARLDVIDLKGTL